ncbi:MAG: DUF2256 domain-containing protein [Ekhidna sp.]|nr:DUF2256 domain-containing protein [Ekhidna sp.]
MKSPILVHKKSHLPTKICVVCGKPFTWRKRWEKDWEKVKYCSERCRRNKQPKII